MDSDMKHHIPLFRTMRYSHLRYYITLYRAGGCTRGMLVSMIRQWQREGCEL
jgi:hypothetical protein